MTHTPDEQRAIAEAATPGPWAVTSADGSVHCQSRNGRNWICQGPNVSPSAPPASEREANARHIATFDPPTMIAFFDERDALLDRLAALEAERAAGEARVVAWLIEFPEAGDRYEHGKRVGPAYPVGWLAGIPWGERWKSRTKDPNEALRFARKEDAEAAMLIMQLAGTTAFASEHIWLDLSAALAKQEPGS